jgi:hypothetical protein
MSVTRPTATTDRHPTNPFATRYTRPGAIPPLDERGLPRSVLGLLETIDRLGGSAAFTGPHGTGKSTHLAAVAAALRAEGRRVQSIRVRRCRDLLPVLTALGRAAGGGTLCIDGWESLGAPAGLLVVLLARLRGIRLIVTSHRPTLLPTAVRTAATFPLLTGIIERLPPAGDLLTPADLAGAFTRHAGNLRESLAELYDVVEARRRGW